MSSSFHISLYSKLPDLFLCWMIYGSFVHGHEITMIVTRYVVPCLSHQKLITRLHAKAPFTQYSKSPKAQNSAEDLRKIISAIFQWTPNHQSGHLTSAKKQEEEETRWPSLCALLVHTVRNPPPIHPFIHPSIHPRPAVEETKKRPEKRPTLLRKK